MHFYSGLLMYFCSGVDTPADVYSGRGPAVLLRRENVKLKTIEGRRRLHHLAAKTSTQMSQTLS